MYSRHEARPALMPNFWRSHSLHLNRCCLHPLDQPGSSNALIKCLVCVLMAIFFANLLHPDLQPTAPTPTLHPAIFRNLSILATCALMESTHVSRRNWDAGWVHGI